MAKAGMKRPDPKQPHGTESNHKTHIPKNELTTKLDYDGLEIEFPPNLSSQDFTFSVAWVNKVEGDDDVDIKRITILPYYHITYLIGSHR